MITSRQRGDVAQILLSVLFLAVMIVACLWIVQPFILSFAWAGTIVIATWPLFLRFQRVLAGRRSLAVLCMTLILILVFVIPIALLVNSLVDGSGPVIRAISSGDLTPPDLAWLKSIPLVGHNLYLGWQRDYGQGAALFGCHYDLVCRPGSAHWTLYDALCANAPVQRPAVLAR